MSIQAMRLSLSAHCTGKEGEEEAHEPSLSGANEMDENM